MIGQIVSHYKILEKLGGGGMGVVYRAADTSLKRQVALKFLPANLTHEIEAKTRFMHEAQAASALDHPNICNIHEIGQTDDGQLFICMTLYEGITLKQKIQTESLQLNQVLNIAMQLASGLSRAHEAGLIHRDLKPANIMITEHNEVKIVDFGLAKLAGLTEITEKGSPMGTAGYMSPEQTRGELLDKRTDIWSYGVIMYELLSGEQPFKGDYDQAVIYSILNESPTPIQNLCPDIPDDLNDMVDHCLQKNPEDRFSDIDEILEILNNIFQQVTPTGHIYKPKTKKLKSVFLKRYALPLMGFVILALTIGLWDFLFALPDEKHLIIFPFKNINGDIEDDTYSAGLTDLLTSRLTQLKQFNHSLQVIPSDIISSLNVTGVADAYDKVGATLAITGNVEYRENFKQLTLNTIDTRSLRQLHSEVIRIDPNLIDTRMEEALINQIATMLELDIPNLSRADFFAVSSNRQDALDYYINGNGYLEKSEDVKNIDTAIRFFNQALDIDSSFTLAYAGLGRAFWLKYEETKDTVYVSPAMEACQTAMDLNGRYPESYLTCGTIYKGIGQYEIAVEKLERAIQLDPAYAQAYWKLGETYLALGDTASTIQTYQQAIDIRPGYWQGYSHLGKFYLQTGQYEKANAQYQHIADLLPNSERGYSFLAITYFYMENFDEAIRMAEKAADINPSYYNLHNLASFYYYDGNYQTASEKYKKVLEYNQNDHRIWGALGMSYYFTDRQDSAKIYFKKAVELAEGEKKVNPRDQVLLVCLAGYYAHLYESEKAFDLINEVEKMNPVNLDIIFDIGDIYEQLGEREEALVWMEKAIMNNYSLAKFTNNPGLKDLIADERFQKIVSNHREP